MPKLKTGLFWCKRVFNNWFDLECVEVFSGSVSVAHSTEVSHYLEDKFSTFLACAQL